ncbi:MAG TPA: acyl-CoA dehydrogenase family protein [Actinokineospora sp.]|nr:acyl-CoA dehydrogenase family protein [Actinokineospora sp.]
MTLIDTPPNTDNRFVELAAEIGAVAADHAAAHDRDATFVSEAYTVMRERGYLALAVPVELGGLGASIKQVCHAQAELAKHDGATALAVAMHQYLTLMQVYRRRKGAPDAETVLRRVADDGIVIATSGGSDWLWPTTTAVEVDGGYLINGRKAFCSQSPGATVVATCAVLGEGDDAEVIHFSVPFAADGVRIEETWDTLGMRGTASHDVVIEDVVIPADKITGRRKYGEFGGPLAAAATHFAPIVGATYYGIGAGARDIAVASAMAGTRGPTSQTSLPRVQRAIGLMDTRLRVAWWALMGAVDELGAAYEVEPATMNTVMIAKREAVTAAIAVVDLAMDVVGGRAFYRRFPLERAYRDVRAGAFHPFTPELTLTYAGKLALGDSGVTE